MRLRGELAMSVTFDEARAVLEGMRNDKRGQAESLRQMADEYRLSANAADDFHLRSQHFESSSQLFADARALDREADALDVLLSERTRVATPPATRGGIPCAPAFT